MLNQKIRGKTDDRAFRGGYLTESLHGAGSSQAQRMQSQRQLELERKEGLTKKLAVVKKSDFHHAFPGYQRFGYRNGHSCRIPFKANQYEFDASKSWCRGAETLRIYQ
jgi:hypothetical protein